MVVIRLSRGGSKARPFFNIVVADKRTRRDGSFIEELGYFNPLTEPVGFHVNAEKANEWIKIGAQPTDTVRAQLKKNGVI